MDDKHDCMLTNREREVLCLAARGMSNKEIAEYLCTSTSTVKMFIYQACIKLKANNRAQAFISAVRGGAVGAFDVFSLEEVVDLLSSLEPESIEKFTRLFKLRRDELKITHNQQQLASARY